jgi:hypothetical protein
MIWKKFTQILVKVAKTVAKIKKNAASLIAIKQFGSALIS